MDKAFRRAQLYKEIDNITKDAKASNFIFNALPLYELSSKDVSVTNKMLIASFYNFISGANYGQEHLVKQNKKYAINTIEKVTDAYLSMIRSNKNDHPNTHQEIIFENDSVFKYNSEIFSIPSEYVKYFSTKDDLARYAMHYNYIWRDLSERTNELKKIFPSLLDQVRKNKQEYFIELCDHALQSLALDLDGPSDIKFQIKTLNQEIDKLVSSHQSVYRQVKYSSSIFDDNFPDNSLVLCHMDVNLLLRYYLFDHVLPKVLIKCNRIMWIFINPIGSMIDRFFDDNLNKNRYNIELSLPNYQVLAISNFDK